MVEAVTSRHGINGPPTRLPGSRPIDGLFITLGLTGLKCGYLECFSDHKALWIDVPIPLVFGSRIPPIVRPAARRLKTTDPRIVHKYLQLLHQEYTRHSIYLRAAYLKVLQHSGQLDQAQKLWISMDKDVTAAKLHAERHCRKLHTGAHPFHPEYQETEHTILFWQSVKRYLLSFLPTSSVCRPSMRLLIRRSKKAGINLDLPSSS